MGVWIPDGDGACTNLLKFALNETNFEHTLIAFVVSMGTPWSIMESLKKWSTILMDHIKKLNIPEEKMKEFKKRQVISFQSYQDPDDAGANNKKPSVVKTDTKDQVEGSFLPLDASILTKNLGIPVVVILTKVKKNTKIYLGLAY